MKASSTSRPAWSPCSGRRSPLVALFWIIAVWAIVSGALMLVAAFSLNLDHGRWWLALGGIASIIFGVLLIIEPLVGAVVLTMWLGAYALVFGVFLLVLAFQLHSARREASAKPPPQPRRRRPDAQQVEERPHRALLASLAESIERLTLA